MLRINLSISSWASVNPCNLVQTFYCQFFIVWTRLHGWQRCSGLTYQYHPEHPSIRVILFRHLNFLCLYIYIDRIPTKNIRRNFQTSPRRYVNKGISRRKNFYCLNKIARMAKMLRINLSMSSWASANPCNHVQTFKIFGASIYYIDRIPTKNIRRNFQTSPRRYVNKGVFRHKIFYCLNKIARMAKMIRINLSMSSWASVHPCNHVQTFYCQFFIVWTRLHGWQRCSGLTYQYHPEHPSIRVILFRHLIIFKKRTFAGRGLQYQTKRFMVFWKI